MSSAIEPSIVLAAYAEPVVSGRRVLLIGPALSALPARLLERGARLVHVCDPDPVRLGEATAKNRSGNLSFSALADGHFALRDGAFDVCIVEDMGIAEPAALLRKVRRALSPRGVALLASANPDAPTPLLPHRPSGKSALDYYALYDAAKAEFEHVRMLGQAPFVGYVVADFAPEGAPEPSLDTAFLPGGAEEPELFLALASQQPIELESFAVIQLPLAGITMGGAADDQALRHARDAEQVARNELSELQAELATERQALATRESKLGESETKLRDAEKKLGESETKLRENETMLFARDAELAALRQGLEGKNRQLGELEQQLQQVRSQLQGASAENADAAAKELAALEATLVERGEHIRKLERELRESERVGKELLRQLPGATPDSMAETQPRASTEALSQKLAKTQADLIATRWALEAALRRNPAPDSPEA